jgi:phosphoribosylglycinamide formyltransferase-1
MKKRVGILISGRGSNMRALIEAGQEKDYPAEIVLVLSNVADAGGLAFAQRTRHSHRSGGAQELCVARSVRPGDGRKTCRGESRTRGARRLHAPALAAISSSNWRGRMINIHPSLLPAYKGLHTHQARDRGGRTLRRLHRAFRDAGTRRRADDPAGESAGAARRHRRHRSPRACSPQEHRIYPEALRLVAEGKATL